MSIRVTPAKENDRSSTPQMVFAMSKIGIDFWSGIVYQIDTGRKKAGPRLPTEAYGSLTRPPAEFRLYESNLAMQPENPIASLVDAPPNHPIQRRSRKLLDSS